MRICIVDCGTFRARLKPNNPVSVHIHYLAKNFVKLGHTVDVICIPTWKREKQVYGVLDVGKLRLPGRNIFSDSFNEITFGLSSALVLRKMIRQNAYDVVNFWAPTQALFSLLLVDKKDKPPFIFNRGSPVSGLAKDRAKGLLFPESWHQQKLLVKASNVMQRYIFRRVSTTIAQSRVLKDILVEYFGIDSDRVMVISTSGVDTELFRPDVDCSQLKHTYQLGNNDPIVLCPARIAPYKNQLSLIKAIPSIIQKWPNAKFIFVGHISSNNYYSEIQEFIQSNSLNEHVVFTGWIEEYTELPRYYNLADIFVLLSIAEGGVPNTLLSAMSCGRATIASSIPQNMSVAKSGNEAIFVDPFTVRIISSTINNLLGNHKRRKKLGEKARKTIVEQFDWKVIAEQMIQAYRETMQAETNLKVVENARGRSCLLKCAQFLSKH